MTLKNLFNHLFQGISYIKNYPGSMIKKLGIIYDILYQFIKKGITLDEYIDFDFGKQSPEFKQSFLGLNEQHFYLDYLNPIKYYSLARNKYLTHKILDNTGIRKSELFCYYQPEGKIIDSEEVANDSANVIRILKKKNVTQCVIKTTESSHGDNVYVVKNIEYDTNDCLITLFNDK